MPAQQIRIFMSMDGEDEVFEAEELSEGFEEEIVEEEGDGDDIPGLDDGEEEDVDDIEGDDVVVPAVVEVAPVDEDDIVDDSDVELALDEVLAETIRRTSVPDDDDEAPVEADPLAEAVETILPKQDDEFRCKSCRLLKKTSQLADDAKTLCRDCV
jgi:hypothetical protein